MAGDPPPAALCRLLVEGWSGPDADAHPLSATMLQAAEATIQDALQPHFHFLGPLEAADTGRVAIMVDALSASQAFQNFPCLQVPAGSIVVSLQRESPGSLDSPSPDLASPFVSTAATAAVPTPVPTATTAPVQPHNVPMPPSSSARGPAPAPGDAVPRKIAQHRFVKAVHAKTLPRTKKFVQCEPVGTVLGDTYYKVDLASFNLLFDACSSIQVSDGQRVFTVVGRDPQGRFFTEDVVKQQRGLLGVSGGTPRPPLPQYPHHVAGAAEPPAGPACPTPLPRRTRTPPAGGPLPAASAVPQPLRPPVALNGPPVHPGVQAAPVSPRPAQIGCQAIPSSLVDEVAFLQYLSSCHLHFCRQLAAQFQPASPHCLVLSLLPFPEPSEDLAIALADRLLAPALQPRFGPVTRHSDPPPAAAGAAPLPSPGATLAGRTGPLLQLQIPPPAAIAEGEGRVLFRAAVLLLDPAGSAAAAVREEVVAQFRAGRGWQLDGQHLVLYDPSRGAAVPVCSPEEGRLHNAWALAGEAVHMLAAGAGATVQLAAVHAVARPSLVDPTGFPAPLTADLQAAVGHLCAASGVLWEFDGTLGMEPQPHEPAALLARVQAAYQTRLAQVAAQFPPPPLPAPLPADRPVSPVAPKSPTAADLPPLPDLSSDSDLDPFPP
eukprot:EG_transcript_5830